MSLAPWHCYPWFSRKGLRKLGSRGGIRENTKGWVCNDKLWIRIHVYVLVTAPSKRQEDYWRPSQSAWTRSPAGRLQAGPACSQVGRSPPALLRLNTGPSLVSVISSSAEVPCAVALRFFNYKELGAVAPDLGPHFSAISEDMSHLAVCGHRQPSTSPLRRAGPCQASVTFPFSGSFCESQYREDHCSAILPPLSSSQGDGGPESSGDLLMATQHVGEAGFRMRVAASLLTIDPALSSMPGRPLTALPSNHTANHQFRGFSLSPWPRLPHLQRPLAIGPSLTCRLPPGHVSQSSQREFISSPLL